MTVKTVTSEDARIKMRDILDDVHGGDEVVIERYRRPAAVVVNYAQWQAWKEAQKNEMITEAKKILADIHSGKTETTSHDELMRLMFEKRAAHVDARPHRHF